MTLFSGLFKNAKLKKELEDTKAALAECNGKLIERQEVINQTNAYWKKKMYAVKNKKDNKKEL
jgi:hypothetical protein